TVPVRMSHVELDGLGHVIALDEAWTQLFGWRPEDALGRNSVESIHPEDCDQAIMAFALMLARPDQPQRVQCRRLCRDGSYLWCEATVENHLADPMRPRVDLEVVDISSEMAAHEQVRARERLLHRLAEALPQGIVQFDRERRVVYANTLAQRMLGGEVTDLDTLLARTDPADRAAVRDVINAALVRGADEDREVRLHTPTGG